MKTDWKDDMFEGSRRYNMITNSDGTVSFEDATEYTQEGDAFGAKELNAIGAEVNETKKSVSDGKTLIAAAITAKKVAAAASDTFAVLAAKIGQIVLGSGNAAKADVLAGKTFTNDDGVEYTGTMVDNSGSTKSATPSLDAANSRLQFTVPQTGKYSTASKLYAAYSTIQTLIGLTAAKIAVGSTILGIAGTYKGLGDASAGDVLKGKKFSTASLSNAEGTMADNSGPTKSATPTLDTTNSRLQMTVPATAKYSTSSKLYAAYSTIRTLIGLTADKLWTGTTLLGLESTRSAQEAKTWTPGTANQTIAAGTCITGAQTIKGDANLVAKNIKKGVTVFGITGSYEGWYSGGGTTYNRGSNDGQWKGGNYAVLETGQITLPGNSTAATVSLRSQKAYNLSGFTKMTITGNFWANVAENENGGWALYGYLNASDVSGNETIDRAESPYGATTSVTLDINLAATRYLGIRIPRYLEGAIYSIVLS